MDTHEWIRFSECCYIIHDITLCEIAINMISSNLVEFSNEAVDGLSFRFTLFNRQSHRKEIFHEGVKQWRSFVVNFE